MSVRLSVTALIYAAALFLGALVVSGQVSLTAWASTTDAAQASSVIDDADGQALLLCYGWGCGSYNWNPSPLNANTYASCSNIAHGEPCAAPGFHSQIQGYTTCWTCGVQIQNYPINACGGCGTYTQSYVPQCWNCGHVYQPYVPQCWNCGHVQVVYPTNWNWNYNYGWRGW